MSGMGEISEVRMTVSVTSHMYDQRGRIEYVFRYPDDVHIPGPNRSLFNALYELGAQNVTYDSGGNSLRVALNRDIALEAACRTVANYLRWLHDFGGGVEFNYHCPHCRREDTFAL